MQPHCLLAHIRLQTEDNGAHCCCCCCRLISFRSIASHLAIAIKIPLISPAHQVKATSKAADISAPEELNLLEANSQVSQPHSTQPAASNSITPFRW